MSTYRRSRRDNVPAAPVTALDVGPRPSAEEDMPGDGGEFGLSQNAEVELNVKGEWIGLQKLVNSPSAPTTPRKRKIHFIEPTPE
ncbi:hypothetical protein KCU72_g15569, partial [Aureobasidium melanogenum]